MKIDFKKIKSIHFTGIKGVGMSALALCCRDLGIKISGSDLAEIFVTDELLKRSNIKWQVGFSDQHVGKVDLLVYTGAHKAEKNIEVVAAQKKNIPAISHAEALGILMNQKKGISVCGVGGKTTISAIIATILTKVGLHPSFAIGVGDIQSLKTSGRFDNKGEYFIAEADEYCVSPSCRRPRFSYQKPQIIVIPNIEFDHPDVFKNLDHTIQIFKEFVETLPKNGLLIACVDNENIRKLLRLVKVPVETYGFSKKADWQIRNYQQWKEKTIFTLKGEKEEIKNIQLLIPGKFNCLNAVGAIVAARFLDISSKEIKKAISFFQGTKRRFEFIAQVKGIKLYDDYAHHPLEIKSTLKAAKDWFSNKRIFVIFQPHTFSRTKKLFKDFSQSFSDASGVIFTDIYPSAREKKDLSISSELLARETRKGHQSVFYSPSKEEILDYLKKTVKKGDIIFTMGAGDIFRWHKDIIKKLQAKERRLKIIRNKTLSNLTTFGIGGKAKCFCEINNLSELKKAINWAKEKKIPWFILGGGSNILIGDKGIKGLVIKIKDSPIKIKESRLMVGSGVTLSRLLLFSLENGLSGLEFLTGIPGTIGGAIVGNAGLKKRWIGDLVEKVITFNPKDNEIHEVSKKDCDFGYRTSRFLKTKEIIWQVVLDYKKLNKELIQKKMNVYIKKRLNQPKGKSAGSIFKNPPGQSAGKLIEKAGLKGLSINGGMVSKQHANFIINFDKAKAKDVLELVSLIKKKIKEKFNIKLEEEIKLIGEF